MSSGTGEREELSMLALFKNELKKAVEPINQLVEVLNNSQSLSPELLSEALRSLHTIKGSAKIVNIQLIVELVKAIEKALHEPAPEGNKPLLNLMRESLKVFEGIISADDEEAIDRHLEGGETRKLIDAMLALSKVKETKQEPRSSPKEFSTASMIEIFATDLESQVRDLSSGLLALEKHPDSSEECIRLMRAAHSIKGAARVIGIEEIVHLAHVMEDCFQGIKEGALNVSTELFDAFFKSTDLLNSLAQCSPSDFHPLVQKEVDSFSELIDYFTKTLSGQTVSVPVLSDTFSEEGLEEQAEFVDDDEERIIRVSAEHLTRMVGLAGEVAVESRWLSPFANQLVALKKAQNELAGTVDIFRAMIDDKLIGDSGQSLLLTLQRRIHLCRESLAEHLEELEQFIRRQSLLSDRLYREAVSSRMGTFFEVVSNLPRVVRDIAKLVGKNVELEILGRSTSIDRDILDKLKSPLNHLIRNAVDHGIESPEKRKAAGKPETGRVTVEAIHQAGLLRIQIADDGNGIDLDKLKKKILKKGLADWEMVDQLKEDELYDFLFLPDFSTNDQVTEISGRGIGLNVVQDMVHEVGGQLRVLSTPGKGTTFVMQLPLTLSVIRSLLVEISGEPYAFPLARIEQAIVVEPSKIQEIDNKQYLHVVDKNIGLVNAHEVLELEPPTKKMAMISLVVLNDRFNDYGIIVDHLLGERELVLQDLEPKLGKIQDITSGAFLEDGSPILIIDVDDIIRSIDNYLTGGKEMESQAEEAEDARKQKRVLVVDDSVTVREVQSRILESQGYKVDVAVNGADGWNSVRIEDYDLVITDIDMPRLGGIEFIQQMKRDPSLRDIPVMIVSYKENEDEKKKGLQAGAKIYLTKSSFQDDSFLQAVKSLIG